jgi:hypothetical protein
MLLFRFYINFFRERRKKCQKIFKISERMAWNLLCKICAYLVDFIVKIITSSQFLEKYRTNKKAFTRNRILPFTTLIYFLINFNKGSIQDELDHFFKAVNRADVPERIVSKSAFTRARKKLKYEAFIELNSEASRFFYDNFQTDTWKGFNLIGVDGATCRLPDTQEVAEHFGQMHPNKGNPVSMARVSQMFDVLNGITLDAIISPKEFGERELLCQHFINLTPDDLVLMDRGYPAFWVFKLILSMGSNHCARVPYKNWKITKKFFNSGKKEKIVELKPSYPSIEKCREIGLDFKPMKARLVRVELDTGETEILITSLLDKKQFPHDDFAQLYHCRWPVEEDYKVMKSRLEIENWSGKTVHSVYQDFHAKVFAKNLTTMMAHPTKKAMEQQYDMRKHKYQLNKTQALSKMKDAIALLFIRPAEVVKDLILKLHEIFIKTVEPIRPGRKYPRIQKVQRGGFCPCYKPTR